MDPLASAERRLRLVEEMEAAGVVRTAPVRAAFLQVPRELFVPAFATAEGLDAVYANRLIVTKRSDAGVPLSSSSEPHVMASMLEALEVADGMRVLELGTGSGYNTALLKAIVGPRGRVVSIELDRELASAARRALRAGNVPVRVVCADAHDGYARAGPYDRIIATASSAHVPRAWLDQLHDGGLVELPLRVRPEGAVAIATFRRQGRVLESTSVIPGRFMPLRGRAAGGAEPPVLTVRSRLGDGRELLTRLGGSGIARLSRRAREHLADVARTPPRTRSLDVRAAAWPLGLYLTLEVPERRLVMRYADLAVGAVGRDGRSLALVEGRWESGSRPTTQRLLAYGDGEAEDILLSTLDRWRQHGRPGAERLRIRISFGDARTRVTHRWLGAPDARLAPARGTGDTLI